MSTAAILMFMAHETDRRYEQQQRERDPAAESASAEFAWMMDLRRIAAGAERIGDYYGIRVSATVDGGNAVLVTVSEDNVHARKLIYNDGFVREEDYAEYVRDVIFDLRDRVHAHLNSRGEENG